MNKNFSRLVFCIMIFIISCSKDNTRLSELTQNNDGVILKKSGENALQHDAGATQVSGIGYYAATGECEPWIEGAAYVVRLTGDLTGCLYAIIDDYECSPSGTYREQGREYFVGTYKGMSGSFWTTYKFEAKYEGCAASGAPLGAEIFGRCQHPIVEGSGEGVFDGVKGRLDFKDDIEAGNFPYRGHLLF